MFEVIPFKSWHVKEMIEEPMNASLKSMFESGYADLLENQTKAFTGMADGRVMICAGVYDLWRGRGYLWCVLSEHIKAHSISVYRGARRWLKEQPYRRIEMDVPIDMEIAHKRAEFLGFRLETLRAEKYLPDGSDASIYVFIRENV